MLPLLFLLFLFFFFCSVDVTRSFPADADLSNCTQTFDCGPFRNLTYPFTGGSRPSYCGPPEFHLSCVDDSPELTIASLSYRVLKLNPVHQNLTLARSDLWNSTCTDKLANSTLESVFFSYDEDDDMDVTIFYGCNSTLITPKPKNWFLCDLNLTFDDAYYVIGPVPVDPIMSGFKCSVGITVPILKTTAAVLVANRSLFGEAIMTGFNVNYTNPYEKQCAKCLNVNGLCGFDSDKNRPVCICGNRVCNPAGKGKPIKLIASLAVVCFIGVLGAIVFGFCRMRAKQKGHIKLTRKHIKITRDTLQEYIGGKHDLSELMIYDFDSILVATDNFSIENKLGQGGFGPVYWGKLAEGKEIAVKKLSSTSGQGVVEFKNEMLLISNLQHKNLVRIMGCCVKEDEKLLIYEFMANKSLDTFLFDSTRRAMLDWGTRFNIIQGVARGLVYLHHDSYLKVIHRDLKVSNILLDEKMNPKISDFGLARSVEGTQNLENTHRVAGTRGYMSPEYAMGGIFSQKSDVYSFGVLVLEIISSKKNTAFYIYDRQLGLLAYAWQLWKEGRELELVDEMLEAESYSASEVMKCVHIGLLCVQDNAMDRPSMPDVVFMLNGSTTVIGGAQPKQPLFTIQNTVSHPQPQPSNTFLTNEATMTLIEGR
ncbi:G-type lectin S-receptor-like serine/threonine-protein kinase At1g61370 isoform X1 [Malus domestica]|uniref:G-type lectin S-receptor-like serine/threonine-protein kinase At1g61370 isoform X1 n=1 Tax=Malus domestica TaxID=3750 RepID=UPI0039753A57